MKSTEPAFLEYFPYRNIRILTYRKINAVQRKAKMLYALNVSTQTYFEYNSRASSAPKISQYSQTDKEY